MVVTEIDYWDRRGAVVLWIALLLAPAAGALDMFINYALVKPVCASGTRSVLTLVSIGALAVVGIGAWTASWCLSRLSDATEEGGRTIDRSYLMARGALALNAIMGMLIALIAVHQFILSPCE
jgi:hypothetical protein